MKNIEELKKQMFEDGASDDHAHEVLAEIALASFESIQLPEDISDEEYDALTEPLIEAYIAGFCHAEGYGGKNERH